MVGKVSLREYEAGGNDGLPSFPGYKDLGRALIFPRSRAERADHYDEESE